VLSDTLYLLSSFEPIFRKFVMNIIPLAAAPSCAVISCTNNSNVIAHTGNAEVTLLPHNVGSLSDA
jgi:hypothetical protein